MPCLRVSTHPLGGTNFLKRSLLETLLQRKKEQETVPSGQNSTRFGSLFQDLRDGT